MNKFELPRINPKVTKELLKSANSEETYMSTYLGVPVKRGLLISPLRNDHKPTASFYRNDKGDLIFHDFGVNFQGDFISVVMYIYHCSYSEALSKIAKDFGIIESSEPSNIKIIHSHSIITEKEITRIQIEQQPFSKEELIWWNNFGVSEKTLKLFRVYSCKSIFLNGVYYKSSSRHNFIFGYYGGMQDGNELWRIYFPNNKNFRFLSNWNRNIVQGVKQLPAYGDNVIISKSLKDTMTLYEKGINALAPNSENTLLSEEQFFKLTKKFKHIFTFSDNDLAGVRSANAYKKEHPSIRCIFIKRKWAKDISDLRRDCGEEAFNEAINELKEIFKNNKLRSTKYFYIF